MNRSDLAKIFTIVTALNNIIFDLGELFNVLSLYGEDYNFIVKHLRAACNHLNACYRSYLVEVKGGDQNGNP